MTEIYLVRHGETEWNVAGRFQGKLDSCLTDKGVAQARACGRTLAQLSIEVDRFASSPLERTRQTASAIATATHFPAIEIDSSLAEVSLGKWDGLTLNDIEADFPGVLDTSSPFDWYFFAPDGESLADAKTRARNWVTNARGITVAVSHGLFGRIIRGVYLGLDRDEILSLPVPQDVIWRLADGRIEPVPTA